MGDPPAARPCEAPGESQSSAQWRERGRLHSGGAKGGAGGFAVLRSGGPWGRGDGVGKLLALTAPSLAHLWHKASPPPPQALPVVACRSGSSSPKSVGRRKRRCPLPPMQTAAAAACRFGGASSLGWAASPPAAPSLSVSPRRAPLPPLSLGWGGRVYGSGEALEQPAAALLSRRGCKIKTKCFHRPLAWPPAAIGGGESGATTRAEDLAGGAGVGGRAAPLCPPALPQIPRGAKQGVAGCPSGAAEGAGGCRMERGCCAEAVLWQPSDSLGVGDKIAANKENPSKADPLGKDGD